MSATAQPLMTVETFLAWAQGQPEGARYELAAGQLVAMAPERAAHVRSKQRLCQRLESAIDGAGLPCEAFVDGLGVRVDDTTLYIPDVLVRCGPPIADDTTTILDPLIVVEILSPSTQGVDSGTKFVDYFRIATLRHYLIVRVETKTVIHHARNDDGTILTRIVRDGGAIALDPPGLLFDGLFAA